MRFRSFAFLSLVVLAGCSESPSRDDGHRSTECAACDGGPDEPGADLGLGGILDLLLADDDAGAPTADGLASADGAFPLPDGGPPPPATSCLSPPTLQNPIVFNNKCPGDSGGPGQIKAGGKDVLIELPLDRICDTKSNISISGAGNVHIVGGHLVHTMADGKNGVNKMINLTNTGGTTFIEGLHIDVNMKHADAIAAYNNTGVVIVQNSLLRGMGGAPDDSHGDAIHPQGGGPLTDIIFQNVSVYTGYQGIFVVYRTNGHGTRHLDLRRVNLAYDPRMPASQKALILIYLGHENPKPNIYGLLDYLPPDGTVFDQVFIDSSLKKVAYHTRVIPNGTPVAGGCATFVPANKIQGVVCQGPPAGGDYAPAKLVGLSYDRAKLCN
jgi:hypothetical protein